jgi:prepilin-type N-terminal cleavage/methylation domain-containing protein
MSKQHKSAKRNGFTLVELAVVIVIIGVLAAFGVPKFLQSVERSKASEAFAYLSAVRAAQERYQARQGTYATDITMLDVELGTPKYFSVGTITLTDEAHWSLTLTRLAGSSGYGQYTVTFTQDGLDPANSTITRSPASAVNPMGS